MDSVKNLEKLKWNFVKKIKLWIFAHSRIILIRHNTPQQWTAAIWMIDSRSFLEKFDSQFLDGNDIIKLIDKWANYKFRFRLIAQMIQIETFSRTTGNRTCCLNMWEFSWSVFISVKRTKSHKEQKNWSLIKKDASAIKCVVRDSNPAHPRGRRIFYP